MDRPRCGQEGWALIVSRVSAARTGRVLLTCANTLACAEKEARAILGSTQYLGRHPAPVWPQVPAVLLCCCSPAVKYAAVLIKAPCAAMRCCHLCAQSCNSSTCVHERTHLLSFSACRTPVFHEYTRKQPHTRTHACTRAYRVACCLSCLVIVLQITRIYLKHLIRQQQAEQVGRA